jgi:membrane associated rhomboid family serine protease
MFRCAGCRSALVREKNDRGFTWRCTNCDARAASIGFLRKAAGRERADRIWNAAWKWGVEEDRPCPLCHQSMRAVTERIEDLHLHLDVCRSCSIVWFDPVEYEQVAPDKPEAEIPEEIAEAHALARGKMELRKLDAKRETEPYTGGEPDKATSVVAAALGMPAEHGMQLQQRRPLMTWLLALGMIAGFIASLFSGLELLEEFGWIPAELFRYGGATLVTSFFLHSSSLHLALNVGFLLIFGDNVEDWLGHGRFLILVALSTLAGLIAHVVTTDDPLAPVVGASSGIAGIIVGYAVRYPKAKMGFVYRLYHFTNLYRWVSVPAWIWVVVWFSAQAFLAALRIRGLDPAGTLPHLAGAAVGLAYAFAFKD